MLKSFLSRYSYSAFIDGNYVEISSLRKESLTNVVTNEKWKELNFIDKVGVRNAIGKAEDAFFFWKKETVFVRANFLRQLAGAVKKSKEELAFLITQEVGKPITEARGEVEYSIGYFNWFASQVEQDTGFIINSRDKNKRLLYSREGVGVCAIITPWNFPLAMAVRKIAAALAAGCTVVCKPTPEAPLTLLALGTLAKEISLPPGVLNIVPGDENEVGEELLSSSKVRKISFTGSTAVGKFLYKKSAETLKKVTLELGGNAPFIVFQDSNIDNVVRHAVTCKFRFGGQTCVCANRFLIHEKHSDAFIEKFVKAVRLLRVGDPLVEETDLSFYLHPSVKKRVEEFKKDAISKKVTLLLEGKESCDPTVFSDVDTTMKVFKEEIFGPIAAISTFKDEEEALYLANKTNCGLAAYLFTEDLSRIFRMTEGLHFGIIAVNDGSFSAPEVPFGGMMDSGFGREGGIDALREYQTEKTVSLKLDDKR